MKRFISAVLLSAAVAMPTMAQKQKTLGNGYPFTQVPFTSVKISQNTFWGARLKAAREVTVPLAFSKCESEHRYKNFEMAAYTLLHPNHPGLDTKEWDVSQQTYQYKYAGKIEVFGMEILYYFRAHCVHDVANQGN